MGPWSDTPTSPQQFTVTAAVTNAWSIVNEPLHQSDTTPIWLYQIRNNSASGLFHVCLILWCKICRTIMRFEIVWDRGRTHLLVGQSVVPPEEAGCDKVCHHHIHSVVVVGQQDAEDTNSTQGPAYPVVPPESLRRICHSIKETYVKHRFTKRTRVLLKWKGQGKH